MGKQSEGTRIKANSRNRSETDEMQELLKTNSLEDLSWLCSLSESELDMVEGLKTLAVQHPKMIGKQKIAQKFDLKMLRALAFVLMKDNKQRLDLHVSTSCIDSSNLLKVDNEKLLDEDEIRECLGAANKERRLRRKITME